MRWRCVLNCGRPYAVGLLADAFQVVERMPAVHAACAAGRLDWFRARVFADVLAGATDEVAAAVVAAVLPEAAGLSSGKLRTRLVAAAVAADEEFAERRRIEAERRAAVRVHPTGDGMSALTTEAPSAVAAAMWSVIDQAAQLARTAGDDRPIGVLRAEAHAALVLRTGDDGHPAMTGHLTITAPLSALRPPGSALGMGAADYAGEAGAPHAYGAGTTGAGTDPRHLGQGMPQLGSTPITTAHLRELLAQLGALGVQAPAGGTLALALTDDDGALLATTTPAELARLAARGCTTHGRNADCGCPALGPPPAVPGYAHTAAQERFLRLRDRTCRHPGCGQPAGRTDADHVLPYDCGGRTTCHNLCCLCRTHHRLKTFARGWRYRLHPDGTLTVTTATGVTRTTRPAGLRHPQQQRALPPPRPSPADQDTPPF
ncbi:HNH endonuclease [Blastococcus sp. TML/C7B]|uniref:HNH endonuclease signature motif containing protein n=1 Tax=Blastococcus sp. TML/C7B TaxID=2798728 RepID=UPI00190B375B|nr:HNH endonuclease signature motif containing protein [Blastococcus sp. TML/C7B]MBN1095830.1 HNH endonuclease [Blastococcus sp. TML/C7B]